MVRTVEIHYCEVCPASFDDETDAKEHERKPLVTLPEGFFYMERQHPTEDKIGGKGLIIGLRGCVDSLHDTNYGTLFLRNLNDKLYDTDPIQWNFHERRPSYAGRVREGLEGGGYRHATEEEVRRVLGNERIVSTLISDGLTQLAIDLEGERTFPLVRSEEPTPTRSLPFNLPVF